MDVTGTKEQPKQQQQPQRRQASGGGGACRLESGCDECAWQVRGKGLPGCVGASESCSSGHRSASSERQVAAAAGPNHNNDHDESHTAAAQHRRTLNTAHSQQQQQRQAHAAGEDYSTSGDDYHTSPTRHDTTRKSRRGGTTNKATHRDPADRQVHFPVATPPPPVQLAGGEPPTHLRQPVAQPVISSVKAFSLSLTHHPAFLHPALATLARQDTRTVSSISSEEGGLGSTEADALLSGSRATYTARKTAALLNIGEDGGSRVHSADEYEYSRRKRKR